MYQCPEEESNSVMNMYESPEEETTAWLSDEYVWKS